MVYYSKEDIAGYVIDKHRKDRGYDISPLKLQKTMYLSYAMWAGNVRSLNENVGGGGIEYPYRLYEDLFEAGFKAWKTGPVDPYIETLYRNSQIKPIDKLKSPENGALDPISFIDSICDQTFEVSDFALIDLVQKDKCWKDAVSYLDNENIKAEYHEKITERVNERMGA